MQFAAFQPSHRFLFVPEAYLLGHGVYETLAKPLAGELECTANEHVPGQFCQALKAA